MDPQVTVSPGACRQFGESNSAFFLITDADLAGWFTLGESDYGKTEVVAARPGASLGEIIGELPDESAVLVAARTLFVREADLAGIGDRKVAVLPCGSTPVTPQHIRYFLEVVERTDPIEQAARADRFFDAVAESSGLVLADAVQRTECGFDPSLDSYVWNQQAGPIEPGEQQIAPAGELSVLPMEITDFDPSRRLDMDGSLTLRGEPIVHAGYDPAIAGQQAELYDRLVALRKHPVVIEVEGGKITNCRAGSPAPEGIRAAMALNELFAADPQYRVVWELGFGINTTMSVVPANCGLNEVYGATNGVVHLGIGLTPFTRFALTFLCPATSVIDSSGTTLLGNAVGQPNGASRNRIRRTKDASCGCH
jgi:hypothetical protein